MTDDTEISWSSNTRQTIRPTHTGGAICRICTADTDFTRTSLSNFHSVSMRPERINVRRLGRQPYEPVWRAMQAFTDARGPETPDELWMVEHDPVFTLGQAGALGTCAGAGRYPGRAGRSRRAGDLSRPGPDRRVSAVGPAPARIGVRELVNRIEQAVIDTLDTWNIVAVRRDGAPGRLCRRRQGRGARACACAAAARSMASRSMSRWIWSRSTASIPAVIRALRSPRC